MAAATWDQYPANWTRGDTISLNATDLQRRLDDPEGIFFAEDDEEINVRITDVNTAATSHVYGDANGLWSAIKANVQDSTRIRIISVYSERTIEPLQITSELMRKILHKYEVHPDFLRVLFSFGEEPHLAEASSDNLAIHSLSGGETCELHLLQIVSIRLLKLN